QVTGGDHRAVQVVQPDRHTGGRQPAQGGAARVVAGVVGGLGGGVLGVVAHDVLRDRVGGVRVVGQPASVASAEREPPSSASPVGSSSPSGSRGVDVAGAASAAAAATDSRAAAATASAVMPNSSYRVW